MSLPPRDVRPGALTALVSVAGTVTAFQQTIVVPILPDFVRIMQISSADASWLVTITMLTGGISVPIVTRMADMYGKRRMLLVSLGFMVAGSIIAMVGTTFLFPLIGRALQGVSLSLIPIGMSVLKDRLPAERLPAAIALTSATMAIGGSLGLPLSGLIYDAFGWNAVFLVSALTGAAVLLAVWVMIDESVARTGGRFDIVGALVLSVTLLAALLLLSNAAAWGWTSSLVITTAVVGIIALAIWIPLQLRHPRPLVDLRVASRPQVLLTNIYSVCAGFTMMLNLLVISQQLRLPVSTGVGFGLSAFAAGLCLLPSGAVVALASPVVGRVIRRFDARIALIIGSTTLALGYLSLLLMNSTVALLIVGSLIIGVGTSFALSAQPIIVMLAAPPDGVAAANGLNTLLRSMGTAASSAALAGVLAATMVVTGGIPHPSSMGFAIVNIVAIALALVATCVAFALPGDRRVVD
jgi:predicted MFS family arabinose efflux permease